MKVKVNVSRLLSVVYPALVLTAALAAWSSTTLLLSGEIQPDIDQVGITQDGSKKPNISQNLQVREKNHLVPLTS